MLNVRPPLTRFWTSVISPASALFWLMSFSPARFEWALAARSNQYDSHNRPYNLTLLHDAGLPERRADGFENANEDACSRHTTKFDEQEGGDA